MFVLQSLQNSHTKCMWVIVLSALQNDLGFSGFFSHLENFAAHVAILHSMGNPRLASSFESLRSLVPQNVWTLTAPSALTEFAPVVTRRVPEDIWKVVLGYTDPELYCQITRRASAAGISREFYYLLKNSMVHLRFVHPPSPLCGEVWLHSRDPACAPVKSLEVRFPITSRHVRSLLKHHGLQRLCCIRVHPSFYDPWSWSSDSLVDELRQCGLHQVHIDCESENPNTCAPS